MTDEMKNALTAEGWRIALADERGVSIDDPNIILHGVHISDAPSRHRVAALCLYQQPFGFTQEDVDRLRADPPDDTSWSDEHIAHGEWANSLASRIAALLPPETPT